MFRISILYQLFGLLIMGLVSCIFAQKVPKGSTLGPLLLLVYVNDVVNSTSSTPSLFADETCLIVNTDSLSNLKSTINLEITRILKWVNAN